MRYKNLKIKEIDIDCLNFASNEHEGDVLLESDDELINLTNEIRKKKGFTDLIDPNNEERQIYYDFYLTFNFTQQKINIIAVCNYGEKDDEFNYELPMTAREERNVLFLLIEYFAREIYNN